MIAALVALLTAPFIVVLLTFIVAVIVMVAYYERGPRP